VRTDTKVERDRSILADGTVQQGVTWNPTTGCEQLSPGCKNCYAKFKVWPRLQSNPAAKAFYGREFEEVRWHPDKFTEPLQWLRPRLVVVNNLSDLFHPAIPFTIIATIVGIMAAASHHIFQVLTKRPERAKEFFEWLENHPDRQKFDCKDFHVKFQGEAWQPYLLADIASQYIGESQVSPGAVNILGQWPLPNLWIGVSVENQEYADTRIPALFELPNALPWVCAEPLLGRIDHIPEGSQGQKLGWILCKGETGPHARPTHPAWIGVLRDQAQASGTPFCFQQWGEWCPASDMPKLLDDRNIKIQDVEDPIEGVCTMLKVGKRQAGALLNDQSMEQYPDQIKALE